MLLPACIGFAAFFAWPALRAVQISFTEWNLLRPPQDVGFANYQRLWRDEQFWRGLQLAGLYALLNIPLQTVLGLGLALAMDLLTRSLWIKAVVLLPYLLSNVLVAMVWLWMLDPTSGALNHLIAALGFDRQPFFGSPDQSLWTVAAVNIWRHMGLVALLFLAGLQNIPRSLYEAAAMQGASEWQVLRRITLPLLRPVMVFVLVTIAPLLVMLRTAFEHPSALMENTHRVWPQEATWVNLQRVLGGLSGDESLALGGSGAEINFVRALAVSALFTALVVVLQTASSALAAYAFARLRFPGRKLLFGLFMGSMMLPGVVLFIPNFILIRDLGLLNTLAGMVAPFALMSGFSIFFLPQFFLAMPRDLEEAGTLDGASPWLSFWRIVLPLNTAPLATIAMLTGIGAWNEFFWPFIVAPGEDLQVLPVALQAFKAQSPQGQVDWTGLMAASTIALLPTLVLLVLAGRKVVESVQFSGGK